MIQVEDKIISRDVFEKHFVCDLNACKGACCVEGDSGAPLLKDEIKKLEEIYDYVIHKNEIFLLTSSTDMLFYTVVIGETGK